jgi:hypothetical protein
MENATFLPTLNGPQKVHCAMGLWMSLMLEQNFGWSSSPWNHGTRKNQKNHAGHFHGVSLGASTVGLHHSRMVHCDCPG